MVAYQWITRGVPGPVVFDYWFGATGRDHNGRFVKKAARRSVATWAASGTARLTYKKAHSRFSVASSRDISRIYMPAHIPNSSA